MNDDDFCRLLQGVKEAVAISRGELKPGRRYSVDSPNIRAIRKKAELSQSDFALLMGVSVRTLQNWEQGRRHPTGPAASLIRIFERFPQAAINALRCEKAVVR